MSNGTAFSGWGRVFEDHVALVVGGGRGIGAAVAALLGRMGATVVVVARTGSEVSRVCEQVNGEGGRAVPWPADVADPDEIDELLDQTLQQFHRLDHLIYCAGHLPPAALVWDLDPDELRTAFEVNVLGPVLLARRTVPLMLERGEGNLVFVSSELPGQPLPGLGAYAASRAGENALVQTLAAEVRGSGVRVDLVTPPPTRTQALRQFRAELPGRSASVDIGPGEDPRTVAGDIVRLCRPSWTGAVERPPSADRSRPFLRGRSWSAWDSRWTP